MAEIGYPYSGGVFGQDPEALRKRQLSGLLFGLGAGLLSERGAVGPGLGKGALFANEMAQQDQQNQLRQMLFNLQQQQQQQQYGLDQEKLGLLRNQDTREDKKLTYEMGKLNPESALGKLAADFRAGLISPEEYKAGVLKANNLNEGNTSPYFTPVYTGQGVNAFNNRTGGIGPALGQGPAPILRTADDPAVQGALSSAKSIGEESGKLLVDRPQAQARVQGTFDTMDRLGATATELANHPGLPSITGFIAGPLAPATKFVSQEAADAQALLGTIKNQVFVNALQSMRELSKTGGAVGNVSDREGDRLENSLVALEQSQGTGTYKLRLAELTKQVNLAKDRIARAYRETYGVEYSPPAAPAPATPAPPAVIDFNSLPPGR